MVCFSDLLFGIVFFFSLVLVMLRCVLFDLSLWLVLVIVLIRCCSLHFAVLLFACILFVILLFLFCWFFIFDLGWCLVLSDVCYFVVYAFLTLYLGLCKPDFCNLGLRNFLIRCDFLLFGTVVGLAFLVGLG